MIHPGPLPPESDAPPGHRIREAGDADAEGLAAVLTDAFLDTWDVRRVDNELLQDPEVIHTWVVESEQGTILATASELVRLETGAHRGYLHWVATSPSARGLGLGELVSRKSLAGLSSSGLDYAALNTDDSRLPAVTLYLKLGFVPEVRSEDERTAWSGMLKSVVRRRPSAPSSA